MDDELNIIQNIQQNLKNLETLIKKKNTNDGILIRLFEEPAIKKCDNYELLKTVYLSAQPTQARTTTVAELPDFYAPSWARKSAKSFKQKINIQEKIAANRAQPKNSGSNLPFDNGKSLLDNEATATTTAVESETEELLEFVEIPSNEYIEQLDINGKSYFLYHNIIYEREVTENEEILVEVGKVDSGLIVVNGTPYTVTTRSLKQVDNSYWTDTDNKLYNRLDDQTFKCVGEFCDGNICEYER